MRRTTALVAVVAGLLVVPLVGAAAAGAGPGVAQTEDQNATTVTPGERLSGVVGASGAELEGEVEQRAYGLRVADAATDDAKAAVVNETLAELRDRVEALEQRKERLDAARANGSLSEGAYRAEVTELAARTQAVESLANRTNETASGLPVELLAERGIDVSAIEQLKRNASQLGGQEVAAIARSIAGPGVGRPVEVPQGPPVTPETPGMDTPEGTDTPEETTATPEMTETPTTTEQPNGTETDDGTDTPTVGY